MALSSASTSSVLPRAPPSVLTLLHPHSSSSTLPFLFPFSTSITPTALGLSTTPHSLKWRTSVSFFPTFLGKPRDANSLKEELLGVIGPLDRGADASPEDQRTVDQELTMRRMIGSAKEKDGPYYFDDGPSSSRQCQINPVKEPLKSNLLDGKWELIYTTSKSILQTERPKFLRSRVNYQAINVDTLRAQNMESWPFFNQVTADLTPLNSRKVAVKFDYFKIAEYQEVTRGTCLS
ncbi:probable plastid-lipid-associated protein 4, chloroplastic isoform X4 [Malania oleifera]|uniref:probable plastid-lipid-associated protein 4, chloroplastic isoform X4 n=1 Tax=Malania oleifera TaxID=397392 RepID=UPI0025AE1AA6|nr:probable plastid-lipid-associated protein 4, chloroplastic isoform X4 [Malania oleifera]